MGELGVISELIALSKGKEVLEGVELVLEGGDNTRSDLSDREASVLVLIKGLEVALHLLGGGGRKRHDAAELNDEIGGLLQVDVTTLVGVEGDKAVLDVLLELVTISQDVGDGLDVLLGFSDGKDHCYWGL